MPGATPPRLDLRLPRLLTVVVLLVMLVAVLYSLWIGVSNYSRIGV